MAEKTFLELQNEATQKALFSVAEKHYYKNLGQEEMTSVFVADLIQASEVSNKRINAPYQVKPFGNHEFFERLLASQARERTRYLNAIHAYLTTPMEVPEGINPIPKPGKIKAFFKGLAAKLRKHPIKGTSKVDDKSNAKRAIDALASRRARHDWETKELTKALEATSKESSKDEVLVER